ncbi:MAG: hypothetical protein JNM94_16175 [Phycisphaerae bacterium]|nr:hypothetical protein [Phycisphaerae bacterium]
MTRQAVDVAESQRSLFMERCETFSAVWPTYRDALYTQRGGVRSTLPLNDDRISMRDANDIELDYSVLQAVRDSDPALGDVHVHEVSVLRGTATEPVWTRRFTVTGAAAATDVVVDVPTRTPRGERISVRVDGVALTPSAGADTVAVLLRRDTPTSIELVVAGGR